MKARLILGSLFIGALIISLWWDLGNDFAYASFSIVVILGVGGALEWNRIMQGSVRAYPILLVAAALLYPFVELFRIRCNGSQAVSDFFFFFIFVFVVLCRAILAGHVADGLDRIARTMLGFLLLYFFYRLIPLLMLRDEGGGLYAAYSLVLTSKACDIGAYLIGRGFGKRKLIPRVSPGKTVAGAVGGLSFSAIAGCICIPLLGSGSLVYGILFGVIIGGITMMSDLAESLIKRCAKVKDSASLMPEMGGVLDLIDSLILAAPAGYLMLIVLPGF
ncbi:MAG: phosphatidate cytidylyltransferase [Planctomycetota bacterium]